jgi:protein-L-isoaspartate(D-aspartate) O-methyltransferase
MADAAAVRRWYAEDLRLRAPISRNMAIVDAFAAVPRERFLGPPPWRVLSDRRPDHSFETPDGDPRWIYHDVLVTIDQARGLNNGSPSLWAASFDRLDLRRGQRVLQVGTGTGYYAAVLAEIVGPEGRVVARRGGGGAARSGAQRAASRVVDRRGPVRRTAPGRAERRRHGQGLVLGPRLLARAQGEAVTWSFSTENRWRRFLKML